MQLYIITSKPIASANNFLPPLSSKSKKTWDESILKYSICMTWSFDWNAKNLSLADKPIYWKDASTSIVLCSASASAAALFDADFRSICNLLSAAALLWVMRVATQKGVNICWLSAIQRSLGRKDNQCNTGAVHCPALTTVSTVHVTDIPFLGKPMQLHWCCV